MKRSMVLSIAIGSLILIMSLGANAYQHSQVKQAQQQISRLQNRSAKLTSNWLKLTNKSSYWAPKLTAIRPTKIIKIKSPAEISFNTVVTKFFEVMNNFKPKTYGQRKDGVKDLISDKLYQQYFSNKGLMVTAIVFQPN